MLTILFSLLQLCVNSPISLGFSPEPTHKFVIAGTFEEAEMILGEEATIFILSGGLNNPGVVKVYPNLRVVLWSDPLTGLIMGYSTKKSRP